MQALTKQSYADICDIKGGTHWYELYYPLFFVTLVINSLTYYPTGVTFFIY